MQGKGDLLQNQRRPVKIDFRKQNFGKTGVCSEQSLGEYMFNIN